MPNRFDDHYTLAELMAEKIQECDPCFNTQKALSNTDLLEHLTQALECIGMNAGNEYNNDYWRTFADGLKLILETDFE